LAASSNGSSTRVIWRRRRLASAIRCSRRSPIASCTEGSSAVRVACAKKHAIDRPDGLSNPHCEDKLHPLWRSPDSVCPAVPTAPGPGGHRLRRFEREAQRRRRCSSRRRSHKQRGHVRYRGLARERRRRGHRGRRQLGARRKRNGGGRDRVGWRNDDERWPAGDRRGADDRDCTCGWQLGERWQPGKQRRPGKRR
jgi:hypothetical protein